MATRSVAAQHCGARALRILKTGQGQVLTRFQSTAYLESTTGELVAIGTGSMPAGPLNLCIDGTHLPAAGVQWHFDGHCLMAAEQTVIIDNTARIWTAPAPFYLSSNQLGNALQIAAPLLNPSHQCDSHSSILALLNDGRVALNRWIAHPNDYHLPDSVRAMIGCGEGLTPAGDDLLCGYLVTLHALAHPAGATIAKAIQPELTRLTSRISAAHLRAACDGEAVQLLHDLIGAIVCNDRGGITQAIAALDHYGHNSGHYAMTGVLEALNCISRDDSQTRSRSQTR